MDNKLAKALVPLVNDFETMKLLEEYVQDRINFSYKQMETCHMHALTGFQGAIKELRLISRLRDDVLSKLK